MRQGWKVKVEGGSRVHGAFWGGFDVFRAVPKPQTLNPKPETPKPKPQTLNPKPETPNPKIPKTDSGSVLWVLFS